MKAMLLQSICEISKSSLSYSDIPEPACPENHLRIKVHACGVCHTELDEIEGRTPPPAFPVVPGHQVVGVVSETGRDCTKWKKGDRVGVGWIFSSCGRCDFCRRGEENLCPSFVATGRDAHGGYAECMSVHEDYAVAIPDGLAAEHAAPLLCAGAIGYRSLRLAGIKDGQPLGLAGFGASAHLVLKLVRATMPSTAVFVFARSAEERQLAAELGATWAGDYDAQPPFKAHAIIDTTPVWMPVVRSMGLLEPGGRLVINAIRKESVDREQLMHLNYESDLWMEKEIKSVANVTRKDLSEFILLAHKFGIRPEIETYALPDANKALVEMKQGKIRGAKVLIPA